MCKVLYCAACGGKNWTADRELALDLCECPLPVFKENPNA